MGRGMLLLMVWPVAVALLAPSGCALGGCNDIACANQVTAQFAVDLGSGDRAVRARVCFDGSCRGASGILSTGGPTHFGGPPLAVELERQHIEVVLDLGDGVFDGSKVHRLVAELDVQGHEPVVLERDARLIGDEPGGVGCGYCWRARLSTERDQASPL
jgi:hypothetical protein